MYVGMGYTDVFATIEADSAIMLVKEYEAVTFPEKPLNAVGASAAEMVYNVGN